MTVVSETNKAPSAAVSGDLREIKVAHSPDSDDAFMFYGLATHKVRTPGLRFSHTLCDIETLNQKAREGVYDVTAISFHAYPYVQDKYALMACGGSVGEGYGPMVVSPRPFTASEIKTKKIAVPGTLTTAYLALNLFAPGIETEVVPFDQIIPQVLEGKYEAGLIIHEGQLTYDKSGLHRIVDLGKWWQKVTGLPLPLGGNAIRRELGMPLMSTVTAALRESIQYGLDHREEALAYAMQFARDLDTASADKFVGMYVNERTLDYGADGREAVHRLLDMGFASEHPFLCFHCPFRVMHTFQFESASSQELEACLPKPSSSTPTTRFGRTISISSAPSRALSLS
jgi:1,4-dihydroxy-6-naphthoate synthase